MTRTEQKRAAIIKAALEEFAASHYSHANMDSIAARAEVSKRTIYKHFPSKEALFREISERVRTQLADSLEMSFDPTRSVQDQLMELAERHLELLSSEEFQTMARIVVPESVHNKNLANPNFEQLRRGERGLGVWMREAMAAGAIRSNDWASLARKFSAMLAEFGFWPLLFSLEPAPTKEERRTISRNVVELFLHGVGVGED